MVDGVALTGNFCIPTALKRTGPNHHQLAVMGNMLKQTDERAAYAMEDAIDVDPIGTSSCMRAIRDEVDQAARSDAKVLITGETGVGKEVFARLVHRRSTRRRARLATINCAGVPDSLLESELFGHVRGSFTGAYRDKCGLLETAPHGTVFLDEVGEMSVRMQAALLRFLETGEVQRVGADRPHTRVDVRVIAATNRDLAAEIRSGTFRSDLYYRLNVVRIHIPPLRERREDIPGLVAHFLGIYAARHDSVARAISPEALSVLKAFDWPGNIRQLKNVIERIVLRAASPFISASDLPVEVNRVELSPTDRSTETRGFVPHTAPSGHWDEEGEDPTAPELVARMIHGGESFWSAVHEPFMHRNLSRGVLREVIDGGLEKASGNYKMMLPLFNMAPNDYRRFVEFLRKFDCRPPHAASAVLRFPSDPAHC
jgi:transcriptional regulator with PAS, ATPase and Fis domain